MFSASRDLEFFPCWLRQELIISAVCILLSGCSGSPSSTCNSNSVGGGVGSDPCLGIGGTTTTGGTTSTVSDAAAAECRDGGCAAVLGESAGMIGSEGGTLEAAGVRLDVGAGALASRVDFVLTVFQDGPFPGVSIEPSVVFSKSVSIHLAKSYVDTTKQLIAYSYDSVFGYDITAVFPDSDNQGYVLHRTHFSAMHILQMDTAFQASSSIWVPTSALSQIQWPKSATSLPPNLQSLWNDLVIKGIAGNASVPPGPPDPCPCRDLTVQPPAIPLVGPNQAFLPGDDQQLLAKCGAQDVTASQSVSDLDEILISGMSVSNTFYYWCSPDDLGMPPDTCLPTPYISVSHDGDVYALSPGGPTDIGVTNYLTIPTETGFQLCLAIGGTTADVGCPSTTIECDGRCVNSSCSAGETFDTTSCSCQCSHMTCATAGANCGTISDGCGGSLSCGGCAPPQTCGGAGVPNQCGVCTPTTCAAAGADCGAVSDGCGGSLSCGWCDPPQTCGGAGAGNRCGGTSCGQAGERACEYADIPNMSYRALMTCAGASLICFNDFTKFTCDESQYLLLPNYCVSCVCN
jgi:hypothetical protein